MKKKIAILGATGHIAKGLLLGWPDQELFELQAFARSPEKLSAFLRSLPSAAHIQARPLQTFGTEDYAAVINGIGIGSPSRLAENPDEIFTLTEEFDRLILDYLFGHPAAYYINFSSGAVYGTDFSAPAGRDSVNPLPVNQLASKHYYGIAKINSEAKHRSLDGRNIVDLRIFGYFSRFTDLAQNYFLNEIIACVQNRKIFTTQPDDFVRDYVHYADVAQLVKLCLAQPALNTALDVYSLKPVSKFEILEFFKETYGLHVELGKPAGGISPTGDKRNYYSQNRAAEAMLGYHPSLTALDCIREEARIILENR